MNKIVKNNNLEKFNLHQNLPSVPNHQESHHQTEDFSFEKKTCRPFTVSLNLKREVRIDHN